MSPKGISVEEAAKKFGISTRAVRFRLEKGRLNGKRTDKIWLVYLDEVGLDHKVETVVAKQFLPKKSIQSQPELPAKVTRKAAEPKYEKRLEHLATFRILMSVLDKIPVDDTTKRHRNAIFLALKSTARGYFQWKKNEKSLFYNECRNFISDAIVEFHVFPLEPKTLSEEIANILEHEALASVIGLARKFEAK